MPHNFTPAFEQDLHTRDTGCPCRPYYQFLKDTEGKPLDDVQIRHRPVRPETGIPSWLPEEGDPGWEVGGFVQRQGPLIWPKPIDIPKKSE